MQHFIPQGISPLASLVFNKDNFTFYFILEYTGCFRKNS
jgi:hypothetical protein